MQLKFSKYQGTGNDFILIDARKNIELNTPQIQQLCHRNFGIGSDGLLLLKNSDNYDFKMQFFNPDGSEATFCGNGGRCIVKFAFDNNIINKECVFEAADGIHKTTIKENKVKLQMINVTDIKIFEDLIYLNTGTHHTVKFVEQLDDSQIQNASKSRYDKRFKPFGTNVNFVEINKDNSIKLRTYEKGVEAETLSCGTGVVASALALAIKNKLQQGRINVYTRGGELQVEFNYKNNRFEQVFLIAPAIKVFEGLINI